MGGGGSLAGNFSSSSGSSRPPPAISLNPVSGLLANMFGIPTRISEGGIQLGGAGASNMFSNRIFDVGAFDAAGGILDQLSPFGDTVREAGRTGAEGIADFVGDFSERGLPALSEMIATGSPVDVDPLVQQTTRDVAEQLSPSTGLYSSDLAAEAVRQGSELQVGAQEAARNRQLGALGVAPSAANLSPAILNDLLAFGESLNLTDTQAGRATSVLQMLAGLQPTGAVSRGNISENESKGGGGEVSGYGMCWVAAEYFGWHTPEWWAARTWLMQDWQSPFAGTFRWLYLRYGERLAAVVRRNRLVKAAFRPLFEWGLRKGSE